jgi:hypothetical protein
LKNTQYGYTLLIHVDSLDAIKKQLAQIFGESNGSILPGQEKSIRRQGRMEVNATKSAGQRLEGISGVLDVHGPYNLAPAAAVPLQAPPATTPSGT